MKSSTGQESRMSSVTEKTKWNNRRQCSAIQCKNYQCTSPHLAFHRFPKDPDRCAMWVQNLRNPSLTGLSSVRLHQSYRVCSAHFHLSQFKRPSDVHAGLKWNAVPTDPEAPDLPTAEDMDFIEMPIKEEEEEERSPEKYELTYVADSPKAEPSTPDTAEQLEDSKSDIAAHVCISDVTSYADVAGPSVSPPHMSPPKSPPADLGAAARERDLKQKVRSLSSQVCKLKAKVRELKDSLRISRAGVTKSSVMDQLRKLLPPKTCAFVATQIRVCQRKASGFRWTNRDKAFFLSLLHASPECYKLLLEVLSMPSIRTLQRLTKSDYFKPDHNGKTTVSQ